ncbi:hypothetical protein CRYUN_Cryun38cG0081300 [Craigia yunnanensis]
MPAFYNERIVPCPLCSYGCQAQANCVKSGAKPSLLQQLGDDQQRLPPFIRCSSHMCPMQVHWHVKERYNGVLAGDDHSDKFKLYPELL